MNQQCNKINKEKLFNFLNMLHIKYAMHTAYFYGETSIRIFYDKYFPNIEYTIVTNIPYEYLVKGFHTILISSPKKIIGTNITNIKLCYNDIVYSIMSVGDYEWYDKWVNDYAQLNIDNMLIDYEGRIHCKHSLVNQIFKEHQIIPIAQNCSISDEKINNIKNIWREK